MYYKELKQFIIDGKADEVLKATTCEDDVTSERERYLDLLSRAYEKYGDGDYHFVSSPGRSEIGGNHTDHQHGHVLAASLNIDDVCCFKKNDNNVVNYSYERRDNVYVDLNDLSIHQDEKNTSLSIIRGIVYKLKQMGYEIGGFDGICDTKVLFGSGISSSACYEVMLVEIFNYLYCDGKVSPIERAQIGSFAEREYFGKPTGLLDQSAISVGGFVAMDFKDIANPIIENYDFSFKDYGYDFILINTKGSHIDLSDEYAAIPNEIREVANQLGVDYLADTTYDKLLANLSEIRKNVNNDRAILRAIHFFREDDRALKEKDAVIQKDVKKLLNLMRGSGHSSYMYLQNVYPASRVKSQALALALALTADFLGDDGTYRVHGGGFDGTIQVVVPEDKVNDYKKLIEPIFGDDSMMFVKIRSFGTKTVI